MLHHCIITDLTTIDIPHLHFLLALPADDVAVLTAGNWRGTGDGETDRALHGLLQLPGEYLET